MSKRKSSNVSRSSNKDRRTKRRNAGRSRTARTTSYVGFACPGQVYEGRPPHKPETCITAVGIIVPL